jgi:radical SAM protein with 4Fe4S-binding SPASM domain
MKRPRRLFCAKPFRYLEVAENGDAYLCCQGWQPVTIGNVRRESLSSLWNGETAREIRRSILDGSFRHCTACPFLASVSGCVRDANAVVDPFEVSILARRSLVSEGPQVVNLAYDRTCNLSCPSCRTELFVATGREFEALEELQGRLLDGGLLARIKWLSVTGSGDPFASRLYRDLLRAIDPARFPRLRVRLHTNALLFTAETWADLGPVRERVHEVEVSVDAACAATYALNRRGGSWETLLENLVFIASLRRRGPIRRLHLSFVVQANNWREMTAFVDLADRYGADRILFSPLRDWNTFAPKEFARRAVHLPGHPEHADFVSSLKDARLRRASVSLGSA